MARNKTIKIKHEKLGDLTLKIVAGDEAIKSIISDNIMYAYRKKDNQTFLYDMYVKYMSDDKMTDILGKYMENPNKFDLPTLVKNINVEYASSFKRKTRNEDELSAGDHITINTFKDNDRIYNLEVTIKKAPNNTLYAYIDNNFTDERYRKNGLMTQGFKALEDYLSNYGISKIALDAINLDGNQNLDQIYTNFGYSKHGDKFVKNIDMQMYK